MTTAIPKQPNHGHVRTHAQKVIVRGLLLAAAGVTAGCANAHYVKTSCGAASVLLDGHGVREPLLNCAGVAVGYPVTIRVGATATVHSVGAAPPRITSSDSGVLSTDGEVIRGVAAGSADVRIQASTLCGSATLTACALMRVTVVP